MQNNSRLLLHRQLAESLMLASWLRTPLKSHRPRNALPFRERPRGRYRGLQQEIACRFHSRTRTFARPRANAAQLRRCFQGSPLLCVAKNLRGAACAQLGPEPLRDSLQRQALAQLAIRRLACRRNSSLAIVLPISPRKAAFPALPYAVAAQGSLPVILHLLLPYVGDPAFPFAARQTCSFGRFTFH